MGVNGWENCYQQQKGKGQEMTTSSELVCGGSDCSCSGGTPQAFHCPIAVAAASTHDGTHLASRNSILGHVSLWWELGWHIGQQQMS